VDSLRTLVQDDVLTGYIIISEENVAEDRNLELIYSGRGGVQLLTSVRSDVREVIRQERLRRAEVSEEIQNIYDASIGLDSRRLSRTGEETDDDTFFLSIVGMILGIIIFAAIFSYGGYVTRGVIEEKTNRIIEVIASSVNR
jgi:ABC-2 type transport system permease protein